MSDIDLTPDEERKLLENFVFSNDDLELLEALSAGFNIFDAIGMKHQEIRHSRTLSFLIGPQNGHGLGQYFLKRVLKTIALEPQNSISVVDVDVANFADAETRCEWNSIDILIICPTARIIVAIENKLLADEHSDQLTRYKNVLDDHPEWAAYRRLFAFLTVDGHSPAKAEDGAHWCSISYATIADELGASHKALLGNMGIDQDVLIRHYVDLLRRSVLEDSEIAKLARKIYQAHKGALDIIFEHRPDMRLEIRDFLEAKVNANQGLLLITGTDRYFRFVHDSWQYKSHVQAQSKAFQVRYVAFEFGFDPATMRIELNLVIGNVPENQRDQLFAKITADLGSGIPKSKQAHPRAWKAITLELNDYSEDEKDLLFKKIDDWWIKFVNEELDRIAPVVKDALDSVN